MSMAEERVIKIGMLGLGTVGTGVYKVLKSQQEEMLPKLGARVELKKILVRNVEKAAAKVDDPSIITTSFEEIANDPEIEIVVEVMGGKQPAMNYILACLDAGKNVVTANKDLVATHGHELLEAAEERGAKYVRFVDDFSFVCKTKEDAIYFKRASRNQLRYILNIQMHPNKIYIQEVKKGIKMVGGVIKPGRAYLSNRTVGNFINAVSYLEEACKNCDKEAIYANVRSINSYLGFLIHYQSYGIRRKAFSELHYFWKACYIQGKFQVVKIKNTVQCL